MKVGDIVTYLESLAPPIYQEHYDNSGLITGSKDQEVSKVLVCLDSVEPVLDEAIRQNANLIIAHHPIVFSGLKSLTGKNYVERILIKAIKNDIAIYAIHTNLDNVIAGVNSEICARIGLVEPKILSPKSELLNKLVVFVPNDNLNEVRDAMFQAGAGNIGDYSEASFNSKGTGTFKPGVHTNPKIGKSGGPRESVEETKIEVLLEPHQLGSVLKAMHNAHPYEEVAYDIIPLDNSLLEVGSGMIGELETPMETTLFLRQLKDIFKCSVIRHTDLVKKTIATVAVCGGSGSFLLSKAIQQKADIFITGDFKYHEFFDADNQIVIADIGHYESEQYTSDLIVRKLSEKFPNFAFLLTEVDTNPVKYFV